MGKLYITLAKSLNGEVGFVVSDHPETGKEIHESIDTESYGMKTFEIEKETLYSIDMDDNDLLKIFKNIFPSWFLSGQATAGSGS